ELRGRSRLGNVGGDVRLERVDENRRRDGRGTAQVVDAAQVELARERRVDADDVAGVGVRVEVVDPHRCERTLAGVVEVDQVGELREDDRTRAQNARLPHD